MNVYFDLMNIREDIMEPAMKLAGKQNLTTLPTIFSATDT